VRWHKRCATRQQRPKQRPTTHTHRKHALPLSLACAPTCALQDLLSCSLDAFLLFFLLVLAPRCCTTLLAAACCCVRLRCCSASAVLVVSSGGAVGVCCCCCCCRVARGGRLQLAQLPQLALCCSLWWCCGVCVCVCVCCVGAGQACDTARVASSSDGHRQHGGAAQRCAAGACSQWPAPELLRASSSSAPSPRPEMIRVGSSSGHARRAHRRGVQPDGAVHACC
jgi:hypothetical protein